MKDLLRGKAFRTAIDKQVVFEQLGHWTDALWSLLLASGYFKIVDYALNETNGKMECSLKLTNLEVQFMFQQMVDSWFLNHAPYYNYFIKALLDRSVKEMNIYMNKVALNAISFFDAGNSPS